VLVNNFTSPEKSLMVIGANVITLMRSQNVNDIEISYLFDLYNEHLKNISFSYFMLGLDFLFIIGYIELNNNGKIELCN